MPNTRKPRLLWAHVGCLLDTSSGAVMSVREMLRQLHSQGFEIDIVGATLFDNPVGLNRIAPQWQAIQAANTSAIRLQDPPLHHQLLKTESIIRDQMTAAEEAQWFNLYRKCLDQHQPDLVFYFGGLTLDLLIADEACMRGIPCVAYLANGTYTGSRWYRDVSLIMTNSQATSDMYRDTQGLASTPVGTFIDPTQVVAEQQTRKRILLVNPKAEKGVAIMIRLAMALEKTRPDIVFEVVESRGNWSELLQKISRLWGTPRNQLSNVVVTPNTTDMRPVYGRARILLAPSLWWEAFGRVAAEAMLNGIPAIVTDYGGLPEVVGNAGMVIKLPDEFHQPPYLKAPTTDQLGAVINRIERWYDDETFYESYVQEAFAQSSAHSLEQSRNRLVTALKPLIEMRQRPLHNANRFLQVHEPQSFLLTSSMGNSLVNHQALQHALNHLVHRGRDAHYLPSDESPSLQGCPFDQHIVMCSEQNAKRQARARLSTPWFRHTLDGLPQHLIADLNTHDWVYVSSHFMRDVLIRHGVRVPLKVVHTGYDPALFNAIKREYKRPFTFLCIAEHPPRNNLPMLIDAFTKAFSNQPDIRLIIQTLSQSKALPALISRYQGIHLQQTPISKESELAALYKNAHCFVLPSGFEDAGTRLIEAMATGLPIITTHYSGPLDFCRPHNSFLTNVRKMIPASSEQSPSVNGWWAEPDQEHLIEQMRYVVEHYDKALAVAQKGVETVSEHWTWERKLQQLLSDD